jgi:hypothetical protein
MRRAPPSIVSVTGAPALFNALVPLGPVGEKD